MDGLGVGRSGGRMKLKVGHATQLPPPPLLTSEEDAAAEDGGKPFLTYLTFIIHAPCSRETREGKGLSYFIVVDVRPLCAPT